MKKEFVEKERRLTTGQERLMMRNWYSLGARVPYWSGSPWRAVGMLFRHSSST